MAFLNRCIWTAANTSNSAFVVSAAAQNGYTPARCANPSVVNGATYHYFAVDAAGNHQEGDGTYDTATSTLTNTSIRDSSNGGAAVTFTTPPIVTMGGPVATDMLGIGTTIANSTPGDVLFVDRNGALGQAAKFKVGQAGVPSLAVRKWLTTQVVASPPTVGFSSTNALSAGRLWPPITTPDATPAVQTTPYAVTGAFNPTYFGTGVFANQVIVWKSVNYKSVLTANIVRIIFQHVGSRFTAFFKGIAGGANLLAKIDGQYLSLTPQAVPGDGGFYYWDFDFGSSASREIEILTSTSQFGGIFTAATDTILPGQLRGPRTVILSDSYGEGTGATYSTMSCMWLRAMDALGWNNFYLSAVGGTGLLSNASGTKYNYYERFLTDVVPVSPDLVIVQGSLNDDGFTTNQVSTQAQAIIALCNQYLPNAQIMFTSQCLRHGATANGASPFLRGAAFQAAVTAAGGIYADITTMPLQGTPLTNVLHSNASQFATSLSLNSPALIGAHYAFADGTRFMVRNCTGSDPGPYTVTTDDGGIQAAQTAGAALTQVGDSPMSGNGHTGATTGFGNSDVLLGADDTHPTQLGHDFWGERLVDAIVLALG